jgi:hypothetical protein
MLSNQSSLCILQAQAAYVRPAAQPVHAALSTNHVLHPAPVADVSATARVELTGCMQHANRSGTACLPRGLHHPPHHIIPDIILITLSHHIIITTVWSGAVGHCTAHHSAKGPPVFRKVRRSAWEKQKTLALDLHMTATPPRSALRLDSPPPVSLQRGQAQEIL